MVFITLSSRDSNPTDAPRFRQMRVEDANQELGISRATAFRRIEVGLTHMADLYRELYEQTA